jgi:small basic protein
MIAILGLLIGVFIGYWLPFGVPPAYARYVSVAFLAGLDSLIGAVRADVEEKYDVLVFVSGFVSNAFLAAVLVYMGTRLGVDLYLAALVTFGVRIFENLAWIRRDLITRHREAQALRTGEQNAELVDGHGDNRREGDPAERRDEEQGAGRRDVGPAMPRR